MQTLVLSTGDSRKSKSWKPQEFTWQQLYERLKKPVRTKETIEQWKALSRDEKADIKDVGGYVGGLLDGQRKSDSVVSRQLVCLDLDFAESFSDTVSEWDLMGYAAIIHTTHSHYEGHCRLRILVPLTRPVSKQEYEPVARKIAGQLNIELMDDTTYEFNRLMFWPSVASDGEYHIKMMPGDFADPDQILALYSDWHDSSQWPMSSRQDKIVLKMADKQGDPLTKPGIIGAFCRVYDIPEAIEKFLSDVYKPGTSNRYTYINGTTSSGAIMYEDGKFLYSYHDTDPAHLKLLNSFDLVRLHLYRHLDEGHEKEPITDQPSMAAMKALCKDDPAVCAELAEGMKSNPEDVFEEQDTLARFNFDPTEQGLAARFVDDYRGRIIFNKAFGWMLWDGLRWVLDADMDVQMLVMGFSDKMLEQASTAVQTAEDKDAQARAKAQLRCVQRLRTASGMGSMMKMVAAIVHDNNPDRWDSVAWELNTPGGIVDLQTGETGPNDKAGWHTKITALTPGDDGREMWLQFIDYVTGGDKDFAKYLQRMLGMACVGAVYEEGMLISFGPGSNGKSTLFGAVSRAMGDYAGTINADVLVTNNGRTDQSYIAAMRGMRLVIMGETEEGARLANAQLKRLTSRDPISARKLYKDPIEFKPVHSTVMHTNFLPRLSSLDKGTRRRIAVAPFNNTKPPEHVITNYEDRLVEECGPYILKWLIAGAIAFHEAGNKLEKCKVVLDATQEYLSDEDWMSRYLEDCCVIDEHTFCRGAELYKSYSGWAQSNGEYVKRNRDFARLLQERGFRKSRDTKGIMWSGLEIKTDDE